MRSTLLSSVVWVGIGAIVGISSFGCTETECGRGTINRAGQCEPADETVGVAKCGPFTELKGDQCVPKLPPTMCDPATTQPDTDSKGVTTCIGTGGGGCSAPLACPEPAADRQTICGQLYNFAENTPFAAQGATGAQCAAGATTGPCALGIVAVNPFPTGPDPRLMAREIYIDDCGRYRVSDLNLAGAAAVVLAIDDANAAGTGAGGVTVPTAVGIRAITLSALRGRARDFEAWVLPEATKNQWVAAGVPDLTPNGIYAGIFRKHAFDLAAGTYNGDRFATQADVTISAPAGSIGDDFYFTAEATRKNIAVGALATSTNGSALTSVTIGTPPGATEITGTGGLTSDKCQWDRRIAAKSAGRVFFQVFRPVDKPQQKCDQ